MADLTRPAQQRKRGRPSSVLPTNGPQRPLIAAAGGGIQNMGNTCFLNAVLQMIAHTALFHAFLDPTSVHVPPLFKPNRPRLNQFGDPVPLTDAEVDACRIRLGVEMPYSVQGPLPAGYNNVPPQHTLFDQSLHGEFPQFRYDQLLRELLHDLRNRAGSVSSLGNRAKTVLHRIHTQYRDGAQHCAYGLFDHLIAMYPARFVNFQAAGVTETAHGNRYGGWCWKAPRSPDAPFFELEDVHGDAEIETSGSPNGDVFVAMCDNGSTGQKPRPVVEHRRLVVEDDAEIVEHVSEFRLRAIVRHQGPSFDSGHYVAFILRNGSLTEFNDSVVTEFGAADEHALADCIDSVGAVNAVSERVFIRAITRV